MKLLTRNPVKSNRLGERWFVCPDCKMASPKHYSLLSVAHDHYAHICPS